MQFISIRQTYTTVGIINADIIACLPNNPSTLVAEGIHHVHFDIAGRVDVSDGNSLIEMNCMVTQNT